MLHKQRRLVALTPVDDVTLSLLGLVPYITACWKMQVVESFLDTNNRSILLLRLTVGLGMSQRDQ